MKIYLKFGFGLRKYFKYSISSEEAIERERNAIHDRISQRQENFIRHFELGVFGFNKRPYLPLLESQKIRLHDIKNGLREMGLRKSF